MRQITAKVSDNTTRISEGCHCTGLSMLSSNLGGYVPNNGLVAVGDNWVARNNAKRVVVTLTKRYQ